MKLLENPFGIHEKALSVRNKRMELISANIANADTPLFRAKDLDFKKVTRECESESDGCNKRSTL